MKILYLGDLGSGQTCLMRMRALQRIGHDVLGVDTVKPWKDARWLARQWQRRLGWGPIVERINRSVVQAARGFQPHLLWADKQEYLRAQTLRALTVQGIRAVHFTPDPYFTLDWKRTSLMDEALKAFDGFACCKSYELADYQNLGKPVYELPLGFCDETHRPLLSKDPRWACQVGFLGGWEPRRERYLTPLLKNGMNLKIWGSYWDFLLDGRWSLRRQVILGQLAGDESFRIHQDPGFAQCIQGNEVYGDDYARALTGSRIGLGFLRKVCPDQHTTRTFEIPACGSMLLADRTEEHRSFFEEGKEADYFGTSEELLDKVLFYTSHEDARARIAAAGYQRCIDGRYAYIHRMKDAMEWVERELM
jgi:spore maturation protein CgeB